MRISDWSSDVCSSDLLTTGQEAKLERIEADFSGRRRALELEMRAANVRLAQAIEAEHGYGQQVTKAVDETHEVMGGLQQETLQHLFAMRGVLDPGQAEMFDKSVVKALTADARWGLTCTSVATRTWRP